MLRNIILPSFWTNRLGIKMYWLASLSQDIHMQNAKWNRTSPNTNSGRQTFFPIIITKTSNSYYFGDTVCQAAYVEVLVL